VNEVQVSIAANLLAAGLRRDELRSLQSSLRDKIKELLNKNDISVRDEADAVLNIQISMTKDEAGASAALLVEATLADRVLLHREIPGSQELSAIIWKQPALDLVDIQAIEPQAERSALSLASILGSSIAQARKEYSSSP
jgi:hypothetical protein